MKNIIKVLSLCLLSIFSISVNAAPIPTPINGSFGVTGGLSATGGSNLGSVTDISLTSVWGTGISANDTSNVTDLSANMVAGSVASLDVLSPFMPVSNFLNIGGWSLELTSLSITNQDSSKLLLEGTGILTGGAGYDPTVATWTLSTKSMNSYSMSVSTVAVVPVPAAVWLFGSGLIGLVGVARRKA